ncbi:MAG: hypothetical protein ACD_71C00140G0001, partial [uncultured bacterium (gcode 4)]
DSSTLQQKLHFIPFGLGYRPVVTDVSFTGAIGSTQTGVLSVTFENPGADSYRVSFGTGNWSDIRLGIDHDPFITGALNSGQPMTTITGSFAVATGPQERVMSVRLCYQGLCSAPYVHGFGDTTFSFKNMDYKIPKKINCQEGQKWFGELGCQDKELVAFAPYDTPGDIIMYNSRWWSLGFSTKKVVGSGSSLYTDDSYHLRTTIEGYPEKNGCVPSFITNSLSFSTSSCVWTTDALASKWLRFDKPNSFFDIPQVTGSSVRWVLVEVIGNTDYLKYDLTPLGLGDKFAIEVSVRGSALKRTGTTGTYFLFNSDDNLHWYQYNWRLYFWYYNGDPTSTNSNWRSIYDVNISNIDFNPNDFYKVQFQVSWSPISFNNTSIKIFDKNNNNLISSSPSTCTFLWWCTTIKSINNLFVWSRNANMYNTPACSSQISCQWNDIIDSVKVYRFK